MSKLFFDSDKYGDESPSGVVASFHGVIQAIVRQRFRDSGQEWKDFVFGAAVDGISKDDFLRVEQELLSAGHKFDWSAAISQREKPEAYKPAAGVSDSDLLTFCFSHPEAPTAEADANGRELMGAGDNVVRYSEDVSGTARYVRSTDRVLDWLTNGVPANTIAVIDDSGGTLTAPILEQFKGVICAGGTVRSHLGILTREYGIPCLMNAREYGIPCLMNARVSGIMEGDTVLVEASAKAKTAEDYQTGKEVTARVWRIPA